VVVAKLPREPALPEIGPSALWLVADALQDPANLGAMIRTADAAGADAVIVGPGTTDPWSPKAVRASMGSVLHLPIVPVADLGAARLPPMCWIALAPRSGKSLYDLDLTGPVALRVGNEKKGLAPEAVAEADEAIAIPMPGRAESLNAAAAVAVCLFEAVRQRRARK
jgi:TrmH family RNA methyltransferase